MKRRTHIIIVEPSVIVRYGLMEILLNKSNLDIDIAECAHIDEISKAIGEHEPDIIIINPHVVGGISNLRSFVGHPNCRYVALQNNLADMSLIMNYDAVITIYDTITTITDTLTSLLSREIADDKVELSTREREVVACVAKGMSNKQIADTLFLSTHTVITHRRNIANKLQITTPAGLTIYAIVNKLIDTNDMKDAITLSSIE